MRRRQYLSGVGSLGAASFAGCVSTVLPGNSDRLPASEVFAEYWYDRGELVVEFQEDADVERVELFDPAEDNAYEALERPASSVRFAVVFPDRLETYVSARPGLRLKAETPDGVARTSVWEPVHGVAREVEVLPDGRARFEIENQGEAPLLVRFVSFYGDVPNPTVNPQADSFELGSLYHSPGILGIEENRPLTPSRTDLVILGGETNAFETTYAPFALSEDMPSNDGDGGARTGMIGIVHASGGVNAYSFTYRIDGDLASIEGQPGPVDGEH